MWSASKIYPSAAADLEDVDGIVTSVATPVIATTLTGGALDGAVQAAGLLFHRLLTVTLAPSAGSYSTSPIVITGTRGGNAASVSVTPATTDGNEFLTSVLPLDSVASVIIPAQADALGAIEVGVTDMVCDYATVMDSQIPIKRIKTVGAGNLVVVTSSGEEVMIPCLAGDVEDVFVSIIRASTTCDPIVAYV